MLALRSTMVSQRRAGKTFDEAWKIACDHVLGVIAEQEGVRIDTRRGRRCKPVAEMSSVLSSTRAVWEFCYEHPKIDIPERPPKQRLGEQRLHLGGLKVSAEYGRA